MESYSGEEKLLPFFSWSSSSYKGEPGPKIVLKIQIKEVLLNNETEARCT